MAAKQQLVHDLIDLSRKSVKKTFGHSFPEEILKYKFGSGITSDLIFSFKSESLRDGNYKVTVCGCKEYTLTFDEYVKINKAILIHDLEREIFHLTDRKEVLRKLDTAINAANDEADPQHKKFQFLGYGKKSTLKSLIKIRDTYEKKQTKEDKAEFCKELNRDYNRRVNAASMTTASFQ